MSLTPKRIEYLVCIHATWLECRRAPKYRDLGAALGVSHVTAFEHVEGLKAGGYLDAEMRPTAKANHVLAGSPIAADVWAKLLEIIGLAMPCPVCGEEVYLLYAVLHQASGTYSDRHKMIHVDGSTGKVHPCGEATPKKSGNPRQRKHRKRRKGD